MLYHDSFSFFHCTIYCIYREYTVKFVIPISGLSGVYSKICNPDIMCISKGSVKIMVEFFKPGFEGFSKIFNLFIMVNHYMLILFFCSICRYDIRKNKPELLHTGRSWHRKSGFKTLKLLTKYIWYWSGVVLRAWLNNIPIDVQRADEFISKRC